jgi:molybdopterin converting factor small subunit
MAKRLAPSLAIILLVSICLQIAAAQDASKSLGTLGQTVNQMTGWFSSLLKAPDGLAVGGDNVSLIDNLSKLSKAVYNLEQDKRFLLVELKRSKINVSAVRQAIEDSETSLEIVRDRLRSTGLSLREKFRVGGDKVEGSLSDLIGARKHWLEDLSDSLAEGRVVNLKPVLKEGDDVVKALSGAHQQLIKLIDALRQ